MKPLAVFAMPKDRNKLLNPRVADSRGKKARSKGQQRDKKKGSEEPRLSQSKRVVIGCQQTLDRPPCRTRSNRSLRTPLLPKRGVPSLA